MKILCWASLVPLVLASAQIARGQQAEKPPVPAVAPSTEQKQTSSPVQAEGKVLSSRLVLEEGTPVRIKFGQSISSADARAGDRVDFEVLEDVRVGGLLVIPKGGIAWGTVTEAQRKRRIARGGRLSLNVEMVRLITGQRATLRAVKQLKGDSHTGRMTAGIVGTGLLFFPVAPFFLFMHGKDITIPKGAELTAFINDDFPLDPVKLQEAEAPHPPLSFFLEISPLQ